ncbi:MAG: Photosystem I reaction center subunit II [Oscillatoriales cyanobacterium]|nr:MAG: Photosystem I reaction center subunit II [Oscillatoriales cyanobacterium]
MAEELTGQPPIFGGSTGGLLTPSGGAAIMRQGDNLLYLPRKEQCIALGGQQLRAKFKISNYKIYRVFPDGSTEYLHPKDGVFPEKVNEGRVANGSVPRNIG